jgi:hypothetical protein
MHAARYLTKTAAESCTAKWWTTLDKQA